MQNYELTGSFLMQYKRHRISIAMVASDSCDDSVCFVNRHHV